MSEPKKTSDLSIWGFAFGYFACYVPYSALTKAVTKGLLPGMTGKIDGFEILPANAVANVVCMVAFLSAMGWWKYSGRREIAGRSVPWPGKWTFLSGLCTAVVIGTTTLAYTFSGVSIVFMLLLMKGGVLVLAPAVDALGKRRVRWFSWLALVLSLFSLLAAFVSGKGIEAFFAGDWALARESIFSAANYKLTIVAVVDVVFYLAAYFVRFFFMTRLAKSDDENARLRYFVEEQLVATPAFLAILAVGALVAPGDIGANLTRGFGGFWTGWPVLVALLIGVLSQGTGIFGSLIFLDKRENTYCIPVNRVSSVFAGILATVALSITLAQPGVEINELLGAAILVAAILVLSFGPTIEKRRAARAAAAGMPAPSA